MTSKNGVCYRFGAFTLDARQGVLLRGSEPVKLPAKAFELLLFLVRNPNQVIDKETLMGEVWKDAFVEDANLAVHISNLRKILNGDVNGHSAIETFPKVGYRFNGEVEEFEPRNGDHIKAAPIADSEVQVPVRRSWFRSLGVLALVTILLVSALLGSRWLQSRSSANPVINRLTGFEQISQYALAPDGAYAAQAIRQNGKFSLFMVHLNSNSRVLLMPPDDLSYHGMKFSRDGNQLYFTRASLDGKISLYRTPILSSEPVRLLNDVALAFGVAPTNDQVCFVREIAPKKTAIIIARLDTGEERTLATREGDENYWSWSIDWSPDGRSIAVSTTISGQNPSSRLVTVNAETGEETQVTGPVWADGGGEGLAWMPDGTAIVFAATGLVNGGPSQIWHVSYPDGEIRKITNDVAAYAVPFVSKDGQIMSAQFEDTSSIWVDAAPFESAVPLTSAYKHSLNWVRSNSRGNILFGSSAGGSRDVWFVNSDGTGERQLTRDSGNNIMPVPSEDGRFLVFASNRANDDKAKFNLWRMNFDGGDLKQLTFGSGEIQPTISPDGQWVYFSTGGTSGGNKERTLWRLPANGGEAERVVDGFAHGPGVSPDGKFVAAWHKPQDSGWKLAVFRAEGGTPLKLFDAEPGVPVKWTPDGKAVAYLKKVNGVSNVWKQPLDGGLPVQVTRFTSMQILNFDWTSDNRIVGSRSERFTNVIMVKDFR